jgi:DNA mismatch endonuclease, patch repair protein
MADSLTKEHRSWNMSRIKSTNSKPEIVVRSLLHCMGYRFRLHRKDLPGKPDIVLPKYRTVIFVHGCFWHRHLNCKYAYSPKTRKEFWNNKFLKNIERDNLVKRSLEDIGWKVLIIWECETKKYIDLESLLESFFFNIR